MSRCCCTRRSTGNHGRCTRGRRDTRDVDREAARRRLGIDAAERVMLVFGGFFNLVIVLVSLKP